MLRRNCFFRRIFILIHFRADSKSSLRFSEAWLASPGILVWHGYSTIFDASVYPMNPAWLTGKMPKAMYTHEHPDGPKLKAFVQRVLYQEEEGRTAAEHLDARSDSTGKPVNEAIEPRSAAARPTKPGSCFFWTNVLLAVRNRKNKVVDRCDDPPKHSIVGKSRICGWDDGFLMEVLMAQGV